MSVAVTESDSNENMFIFVLKYPFCFAPKPSALLFTNDRLLSSVAKKRVLALSILLYMGVELGLPL